MSLFRAGGTPRWRRARSLPRFNLALQGGGAHGAYTWGVLDRLLEEPDFRIHAVSGTSAGAMNAVVLAAGWLEGGRAGARDALAGLWRDVADLARLVPVAQGRLPQLALDLTAQLLSPYQLNPLGLNPLRDVLARRVDFEALQAARRPRVMVAATAVASGQPVLFEGRALTIDAVLASACLPQIYHAVEIDGAAYWDGGYSSNPPLLPLIGASRVPDLLLVQINPLHHPAPPRTAAEIRNRIGEIVFGRPLGLELEALERHRRRPRLLSALDLRPGPRRLSRHRLHRIDGSVELGALDPKTKVLVDPSNLLALMDRGRRRAAAWLADFRGTAEAEAPAPEGEARAAA